LNSCGTRFNPNAQIDRLTVAIALVKALGLDDQAAAASFANPGLVDWQAIPFAARGYVSLAVTHGVMSANAAGQFRPADAMTQLELARAAFALVQATR